MMYTGYDGSTVHLSLVYSVQFECSRTFTAMIHSPPHPAACRLACTSNDSVLHPNEYASAACRCNKVSTWKMYSGSVPTSAA
jgi:hypothetical protein